MAACYKRTSLFQCSNGIFGKLLVRSIIFFNNIAVGMHLLNSLLHYFDMTFISFELTVSGILLLPLRSSVVGCVFSNKS